MARSVLISGAILFLRRGIALLWLEQVRNLLMSSVWCCFHRLAYSFLLGFQSTCKLIIHYLKLAVLQMVTFSKKCWKGAVFPKKWIIHRGVKYPKEWGKTMAGKHFSVWQEEKLGGSATSLDEVRNQLKSCLWKANPKVIALATLAVELLLLLSWGCWYHAVWNLGSCAWGRDF